MRPGSVAVAGLLAASACTYNSSAAFVQPAAPPLLLTVTTDPPPRDDGTVPRSARVLLLLDGYPDPDSVRYGPVTLRSGRGNFDIRIDVDLVDSAVVVTPRTLLDPDTQYELVASGLVSLDGRVQRTTQSFAIHAGSDAGAPATPPPTPTWYGDIAPAIGGCAPFCHSTVGKSGATRTPTSALDLTTDPADPSFGLINVPSVGLRGTPVALERVAPADPARSVLLRKLIGGNPQANSGNAPYPNMRVDGQRMPIDINDPDERSLPRLSDDTLHLIQDWIAGGAPVGTP